MVNDFQMDLKQDTITAMLNASGLTLDKAAVATAARNILKNARVSPLGKAIATISKEILAGNSTFEKSLLANPSKALSSFWSGISAEEKKLLSDPNYLKNMVAELKNGVASPESLKDGLMDDMHRAGVQAFFGTMLANNAGGKRLRDAFNSRDEGKITSALKDLGIWDRLPPEFQQDINQPGLAGNDNRWRMAAIVNSAAMKQAIAHPENVAKAVSQITVFNSLDFFDKMDGGSSVSVGDAVKSGASSVGSFFSHLFGGGDVNSFDDDKWVQDAEKVLNGVASGQASDGRGQAAFI